MARHNDLGKLGEKIAVEFLERKGFTILDTNYSKRWGEIDIICQAPKANIVTREKRLVHFVEVKSTSKNVPRENKENVSCETYDSYRPEEMVHPQKIKRLRRVIQTYILEKHVEDWQFDVIVAYINENKRIARCKYLKDIIL